MKEIKYDQYWYGGEVTKEMVLVPDDTVFYKLSSGALTGVGHVIKIGVYTQDFLIETTGIIQKRYVNGTVEDELPLFSVNGKNYFELYSVNCNITYKNIKKLNIGECYLACYNNKLLSDEQLSEITDSILEGKALNIDKIMLDNTLVSVFKVTGFSENNINVIEISIKNWFTGKEEIAIERTTIKYSNLHNYKFDNSMKDVYYEYLNKYIDFFKNV